MPGVDYRAPNVRGTRNEFANQQIQENAINILQLNKESILCLELTIGHQM